MSELFDPNKYNKPQLTFTVNGIEVEATEENTTLFRYKKIGHTAANLAMYDHLFYANETGDMYLYGFLTNMSEEQKDLLTIAMISNGYNCILNQDKVAECDIKAFDEYVIQPSLNDIEELPDCWE